MASLETSRRKTIENLHDLTKQIDKILVKTKNKKFAEWLTDVKEHAAFTTTNNKVVTTRQLKKIFKLINKSNKHLQHQVWNHWRMKRKIKRINKLLGVVLDY